MTSKTTKIISTITAIISAIILLQTLYFKFSAAPESVYIFSTLGLEPVGRIGIGIAELISALLIIIPKTRWFGALLTIGIMSGAVFSHLTKLGIVVQEDGGYLFGLCLTVLLCASICLYLERANLMLILKRFQLHRKK